MGGRAAFWPFTIRYFSSSSFFFLITIVILASQCVPAEADDSRKTPNPPSTDPNVENVNGESPPPSTLVPPSPFTTGQKFQFFKPSVAILVGIMVAMLSLAFLLLLYAKHCKRGNVTTLPCFRRNQTSRGPPASVARKNSGIDRIVIESLPIFRFGSLMGEKDGLECAVCLTMFESTEVLRLLPKCKHAFHVECVDTWLDAHSTCPLCRYRVDPEDILLVGDEKILPYNQPIPTVQEDDDPEHIESGTNQGLRRVSGRHSSACERGLAIQQQTTSYRRSLDNAGTLTGTRRNSEPVGADCLELDRPRIDGLLLSHDSTSLSRRLEHRIIVSPSPKSSGFHHRWSDVQASDLLYLTWDKIISDGCSRVSASSEHRPSLSRLRQQQNMQLPLHWNTEVSGGQEEEGNINSRNRMDGNSRDGRGVINSRSLSEITGLSRYWSRNRERGQHHQEQERQAGVVSRWMAWISQSHPAVRY
ncbi:hypothetical protein L6164_013970 [Bauhinia variegata]|uniref:Uncharacterized protein n=1 Tax=Bauhinia variegata TaxID=167791 RepID=A0ACB9NGS7_BAUVA|nr:hypothetical protein L6164_013970 [Bauhinia variegata]